MNAKKFHRMPLGFNQSGFAILEALIAFIVLGVGLLVLLNFHNAAIQNAGEAKVRMEAIELAQTKVEEIRSFLDIEDDWDARMVNGAGLGNYAGTDFTGAFTRTWTVSLADVFLPQINVTVSWPNRYDPNAADAQVQLNSVVYKVDPAESARVLGTALAAGLSEGVSPGNEDEPDPDWEDRDIGPEENPAPVDTDGDGVADTQFSWRVRIWGQVDRVPSVDLDVEDPNVAVVEDQFAACDFGLVDASGNGFFECWGYYNNAEDGWSGRFDFALKKKKGGGTPNAVFCFPLFADEYVVDATTDPPTTSTVVRGRKAFSKTYSNVTTTQNLFIEYAANTTSCSDTN